MIKLKYPTKFVGITKGFSTTHTACDYAWNNSYGGKNCDIFASGNGIVTSIRDGRDNTMTKGDSGNYVTIKYSDGYETRACHLLKNSITVKVGDVVTTNTKIAKMGNSGYCMSNRANHCHYIVWKNGIRVNPVKHLYVYPDNVVAKSNEYDLLYYTENEPQKYTGKIPSLRLGIYGWKRGDKNQNVGYIQEFLNWYLGCNLKIDNSYGSATEEKVKEFQKKSNQLQVDGKWGPATSLFAKQVKK